ncbi:MAG: type II secretion system F family protein [Clostridiaceae bacterium]
MKMIYLIILLVFLVLWVLISSILIKIFNKNNPLDKLKYFDENYVAREDIETNSKKKGSILKSLSKLVPNLKLNKKQNKKLEIELMKADINITVEELLIIRIFFSSSIAFITYIISKNVIVFIVMVILVWNIPKLIILNRKKERMKLFDSQLNEGVVIISNSLKAGYSFLQALAVVTEETKDPFSKEFKKLLKEMSLGIPEDKALTNLLSRMESEDLKLIINAILIQKDTGGNLSEILDNISETIRERQKIKGELKTLTAQGKLSGIIVMLIPVFLGIAIYLFNKEYVLLLFTTTTGIIMIVTSILSEILGFFMIRKIVNIDI